MTAFLNERWLPFLADTLLRSLLALGIGGSWTLLLRRTSAANRHLIWLLTFLGLLLLPILRLVAIPWPVVFKPHPPMVVGVPAVRPHFLSPRAPRKAPYRSEVRKALRARQTPVIAHVPAPPSQSTTLPSRPVFSWALGTFLIWLCGVIAILARIARGLWQVRRLARSSRPFPARLLTDVEEVEKSVPRWRTVTFRLLETEGTAALTWGFLRPVVALPSESLDWPPERRKAVLLHELAHVRRGDWLIQLLVYLVCALYWFDPLVWLAARRLRLESERACDDAVLEEGMKASDYAKHLQAIADSLQGASRRVEGAVAMARSSALGSRIKPILAEGLSRKGSGLRTRITALVLSMGLLPLSLLQVALAPLVLAQPALAQSTTLTTLYSFSGYPSDGANPSAGLIQASDGNLYGTTQYGGANPGGTVPPSGAGTIFKITLSGTMTSLFSFSGGDDGNKSNGQYPVASLIQGSDGILYGTTIDGGWSEGVVFGITTGGTLTFLNLFNSSYADPGGGPYGGVLQASDGTLYGTASIGGANGDGTVFQIKSGTRTTLYTCSAVDSNGVNADGAYPRSNLLQTRDGNLYGVMFGGGPSGLGTVFRITTDGILTTLHSFSGSDGANPYGRLIQASDGNFYGTTALGGTSNKGTVFRLSLATVDLCFQIPSTGQLAYWFLDGVTPLSGAFISPTQNPAWQAVGKADFNNDGKPDILFQNTSTGQLALWLMDDTTATGGLYLNPKLPSGWKVVSIADFNGDGSPDLLLQNSSSGQLSIWYMSGSNVVSGAYVTPTPSKGWTAVGTGDFNKDGHPDILLQNQSTGQLAVWYMNNNTATGGTYISPWQQSGWRCVSVMDLNGDGWPDLVFQNANSGKVVYWLMNGVKAVDGNRFSVQPQAGWLVVGPH